MKSGRCLLIDAGNTRIKWVIWQVPPVALGAPPVWAARGDLPTSGPASLLQQMERAVVDADIAESMPLFDVVLLCSVASDEVNAAIEAAVSSMTLSFRRFRAQVQVGPVLNDYQQPTQLGADRLAAALGAWSRVKAPALVVCAGTATTVDVLQAASTETGRFCGGIILPGLDLMRRALVAETARLPEARGAYQALPKNTDDAITSGCLNAQIGAIERMRSGLPVGTPCLLAGGAAERLLPWMAPPLIHAPDLVLEGLAAAILHGFQP